MREWIMVLGTLVLAGCSNGSGSGASAGTSASGTSSTSSTSAAGAGGSATVGAGGGTAMGAGGGTATGAGGGSATGTGGGTATGTGGSASTGTGGGATTGGSGGAGGMSSGSGGAGWGVDQCSPTPQGAVVGYAIGDQLPDIVLKDCDDNEVSLKELCGAKALWVFAAYGWCPLCKNVSSQQEMIHDSYAAMGLASVNVLIQNGQGATPDANFCKTWRDKYGLSDVRTLYDPTGAVLALWPEQGTTSMSAFVDSDQVLVSRFVHSADVVAIKAGIQGALDH